MGLIFLQACDLARDDEVFIFAKWNAVFLRKTLRTFAYEVHMRTFAENLARGANRILHAFDAAHSTGAQRGAIHEQRVHFNFAFAVEKTATAGVKSFVVLQNDDGFFHRIESRSATLEHAPTRCERVANTIFV